MFLKARQLQGAEARQDARLEDYLNDKLQTFADFEVLDTLLSNVQTQQDLLQRQLEEAKRDLKQSKNVYHQVDNAARQQAQAFRSQQRDIDRRVQEVTRSETSDDAVRQFDTAMEELRRLEMASGYLEMLDEVDKLSTQATEQIEESPIIALDAYRRLQSFSVALKPLQDGAEEAAPHLVDYVVRTSARVQDLLSNALSKNLEDVLKKILWPKPSVKVPDSVQGDFRDACQNLLILQKPVLLSGINDASRGHATCKSQSVVLLPLQVMVKPLETRFQYHFSGTKTTNRLDKPEYFLSHTQDLLNTYATFMNDHLQPALLRAFRSTELVFLPNIIDATSAFITALLPMLRNKVSALIPQVSNDPRLLSHLMDELMNFDETLRNEWRYGISTTDAPNSWKGLAGEVFAEQIWWDRWLQVEKDFALARYQSIIDDRDSSSLDYDGPESNATKPSKAAIRVNDLLETITDRYRRLASFSQKLRFLIDIQVAIFDQFHERLQAQLRAFEVGRYDSAKEGTKYKGINGLDQLCRVFGSAEYLEHAMRDWSDDVFFVELWNELQTRVQSRGQSSPVTGSFSLTDIASRTSSTLRDDADSDVTDTASGALFDETAAAYARLRARTEGIILSTLESTLKKVLSPYAHNRPWSSQAGSSLGGASDDLPTTSSAELNPVLEALNSHLEFLSRALGTVPLRRLGRQVAHILDSYFLNIVILGNAFNDQGAQQVRIDTDVVASLLDRHVGGRVGSKALRRSLEASGLIALRYENPADDLAAPENDGADPLDLREVEQRLLIGEESASKVLASLECERLSVAEARKVIARRVELDD